MDHKGVADAANHCSIGRILQFHGHAYYKYHKLRGTTVALLLLLLYKCYDFLAPFKPILM